MATGRWAWICFALAAPVAFAASAASNGRRAPVVVELFTSEGCSSCPPADELLSRLERTQPVEGARIIALEEHVDYWNQLGWTDRFSAPLYRARQNDYAREFKQDSVYTPQMVVNGMVEFVGSDAHEAYRQIAMAVQSPRFAIRLQPQRNATDPDLIDLSIYVHSEQPGKPSESDICLAITENRLSSDVLNGENAGRRLRHGPVVRSFGVIGNIAPKAFQEAGLKSTLKLPVSWKPENLRAVVFIQDHESRRITGAAVTELP